MCITFHFFISVWRGKPFDVWRLLQCQRHAHALGIPKNGSLQCILTMTAHANFCVGVVCYMLFLFVCVWCLFGYIPVCVFVSWLCPLAIGLVVNRKDVAYRMTEKGMHGTNSECWFWYLNISTHLSSFALLVFAFLCLKFVTCLLNIACFSVVRFVCWCLYLHVNSVYRQVYRRCPFRPPPQSQQSALLVKEATLRQSVPKEPGAQSRRF